jgi:1-acyl-sn-glycerol-3-phosphate acyltransferase
MQAVVIDQPYQFVPPFPGTLWVRVLGPLLPYYLRRSWGVEAIEFRGLEHLRQSLAAGHGVVLTPNHPRPSDPMVMGLLSAKVGRPFHAMASWHVFLEGGRLRGWLIRRLGGFSVHRWGMDREALKAATAIVAEASRPLVLFPEGLITRTNDRLGTLLEGTAFIARAAARQRAKNTPPGQVVLHPVGLKYFFEGDLSAAVEPVLKDIEYHLTWHPQLGRTLHERIAKIGRALLSLQEIEYLGESQSGPVGPRLQALIDCLLQPLEKEWLGDRRAKSIVERVKALRTAILPDLVTGDLAPAERERRRRQLADIYRAQQLALYPPDYIAPPTTPERILETVERFEEDLTDKARIHWPLRVVLQVGEPLEASPAKEKAAGGEDPLMQQLEQRLTGMLAQPDGEARTRRTVG